MEEKWKFDLYCETDGILAIFPFGEFKTEIRKNPKPLFKLISIALSYSYETTHFNLTGQFKNRVISFVNMPALSNLISIKSSS